MKRFFFVISFFLFALNASGQLMPIVNTTGTSFYGSLGMTVTSTGSVSTGGSPCLGTPLMYWVGDGGAGSYSYSCSMPVYRICVQQWGLNGGATIGTGEYMRVYINGSPYSLTAADMTSYVECTLTVPGYLFSGFFYAPIGGVGGGDFTINSCTPIYSFQLYCNGGAGGTAYHLLVDTLEPSFCVYNNGPLCNGATLQLTKPGDSTGATYYWYGPAGFTSTLQDPVIPDATFADSGIYHVVKTVGGIADSGYTHVTIKPIPVLTLSSNSPVCYSGNTLNLFAGPDSTGETFSWSGPASFTSAVENPTITGFVASDTGTYTAVANWNGCLDTASIHVTIGPPPAISAASICIGVPTAIFDSATGGTWTSGATGVATINPLSGVVTGVSLGTAIMTYSFGPTCPFATAVVHIVTVPTPITGALNVCAGQTTLLSEAATGGTWSSSNPTIASAGATTGIVTGGNLVFTNTAIITYTAGSGCLISVIVTVNVLPNPIVGSSAVCEGSTTLLSDAGGGTWSSSNTLIATVGSSTGVAGGVALTGGSVTITYTLPTGCDTTTTLFVTPLPDPITGVTSLCVGGTTTMSETSPAGYWQSSNNDIASVDPFSGTVYGGTDPGVDTITYTTTCTVGISVTVNPAPPPVTGPGSVCTGSAITLLDAVTGGTWASDNSAIASIGLTTGVVTGGDVTPPATSGFATITYTAPSGCTATTSVILYPPPGAITGTLHVCSGQSTSLADAPGGGTWMSSNTSVAAVTPGPPGGIVTGALSGTSTITYTQAGTLCTKTAVVTVNSAPGAITGTASVCVGSCTTLSDATTGGTWTSSNASVATAGATTGVICGVVAGTATITYSFGGTCVATIIVTVHTAPATIGGTASACVGTSTTLTDGAGTWASSNTTVATIGVATSGAVYGASPGTSVITFSPSPATGCSRTVIVTINPLPTPYTVVGGGAYCAGGAGVHIGLSGSTAGCTYKLYNGTILVATVTGTGLALDFGPMTGVGVYTATATCGCTATMTGSVTIAINPLPPSCVVSGGGTMCPGSAGLPVMLGCSTIGCSYQLYVGAIPLGVPVAGTGSPLDFGPQTTPGTITCVATNIATGCTRTMTGSATIIISTAPVITGATAVCVGQTIAESVPGFSGGTWTSSITSVATIIPTTGSVWGVVTGTTTITYMSVSGCAATTIVTVSLSPGPISGPNSVCVGATALEGDSQPGGVWSSSPVSVATVVATGSLAGTVTGVVANTVTITYSLGGTGCTVGKTMTVTPSPAAILGATGLCAGATGTLTDAEAGGTWISSNSLTATVSGVSGTCTIYCVLPGTSTITYTLGGCTATTTITVNAAPGPISGPSSVCSGSMITLIESSSGGSWISSNTSVATVDASGDVWGVLGGTSLITYSLGGTCVATKMVSSNPISPITGSTGICVGATTSLSDGTGGGTWASSNTAVAPVSGTGIVTGALAGTTTITYTTAGSCSATVVVTVNTAPTNIGGSLHVCVSSCTLVSDGAGGGTWSSSNNTVATINGSGLVCGIISGTSTITYSLGFGCTRSAVVTVNPAPPAITGVTHACAGSSTPLGDAVPGGSWTSDNTAIAAVNLLTGAVSGTGPGTATITYSPPSGCATSTVVTINPLPSPIVVTGSGGICIGTTTTLTEATTGGTWISSNSSVATVDISSGILSSITAGTTAITYTPPTGCPAIALISVNSATAPITGVASVCVGATTALSDTASGGLWISSATGVATISGSGIVTGLALGTSTISYITGSCPATIVVTINSLPEPVSGIARICAGATTTLSSMPDGGSWSSSLPGVATVDITTGIVSGIAGGIAPIAYSLGAGCTVSIMVTIDAIPLPITGISEVCAGYTTSLSDASSGVWSSSNTLIASISGAGVVRGLAGGPSIISYSNALGCAATRLVSVVAVPPILGVTNMCAFSTTLNVYDSAAGGFWTSTSASISSMGIVTPYSAGPAMITYTLPLGCYVTAPFVVNPLPGPIVGLNHLCLGSTMPVSDTSGGGIWSSSNSMVAPVSGGGLVSGMAAGASVISYTFPTGCASTEMITVDVFPEAGTITGLSIVCAGSSIVLSDVATGGAWSASNTAAAVFGGIVSGAVAGTDNISYTVSNSCGSIAATKAVTINPLPFAGSIAGPSNVCVGDSIVLTDAATGGIWSSSGTDAIVADGVVSGAAAGMDTIKYTVTNSCGTNDATKTMTINALPDAGTIIGTGSICAGGNFVMADAMTGGTWSSSNAHISISSSGIISGLSQGTDTISYAVTNICGTSTVTYTVNINTIPTAGVIAGSSTVCSGFKDTLTGTPAGGDWSASNGNVIITPIAGGVVISGVSPGADTITYSISNECGPAVAIFPMTICDMTGVALSGSPSEGEALRVWPNPNGGVFTVMLSSGADEPVRLIVTNIVGEKVTEVTTTSNKATEIKLDDAAGVYFVSAFTATGNYVVKVVFAK